MPLLPAIILLLCATTTNAAEYRPKDYTWTTQSKNSSESMPCGGHDVGMNVWVENGDVLFYVSQSGALDENGTLLKAGRFRLRLTDGTMDKDDFTQTLSLYDGATYINAGDVKIRLWADTQQPIVFMTLEAKKKHPAVLSYESWRYKDRPLTKAECQQSSWKWTVPTNCMTYADSITTTSTHSLRLTHTNRKETVFDHTVKLQKLDDVKDYIPNTLAGNSFGGLLTAPDFTFVGTTTGRYASTDYMAWNFKADNIKRTTIEIRLTPSTPTDKGKKYTVNAAQSQRRSTKWWNDFWQRSYIIAEGEAEHMTRNYELFRYMLACNAYGNYPTKFNGGLFPFDPVYADPKAPFTPDYRKWGGSTMTAQNQRLVYWPMLKSGDADIMKPQFDTYLRMLPAAKLRAQHYWNHGGAVFSEQIESFGLPNPAEYGNHSAADDWGVEKNLWLEYQWDTVLEFCSMILMAHDYADMDITPYHELISQSLRFFDEHYRNEAIKRGMDSLSTTGKLVIFPSSGCETYKWAHNPASVIAALKTVTTQWTKYLTELSRETLSTQCVSDELAYAQVLATRIPDIPLRTIDGKECIAPAELWSRIQNVETPQLYPVFPWRVYGVGKTHLDVAQNTYAHDPHALKMRSTKGWKQDNIWAACLALTDEAFRLNKEKLTDGPYRFPAFWDPGYDWAPDCNKGGAAMIGMQEMLLQEADDGTPLLFPAWPKNINAKFKLHLTGGRTIRAEMKDGKVKID